jgi:hypothetical protein
MYACFHCHSGHVDKADGVVGLRDQVPGRVSCIGCDGGEAAAQTGEVSAITIGHLPLHLGSNVDTQEHKRHSRHKKVHTAMST